MHFVVEMSMRANSHNHKDYGVLTHLSTLCSSDNEVGWSQHTSVGQHVHCLRIAAVTHSIMRPQWNDYWYCPSFSCLTTKTTTQCSKGDGKSHSKTLLCFLQTTLLHLLVGVLFVGVCVCVCVCTYVCACVLPGGLLQGISGQEPHPRLVPVSCQPLQHTCSPSTIANTIPQPTADYLFHPTYQHL